MMALGHHGYSRIVIDVLAVAILAQAFVHFFQKVQQWTLLLIHPAAIRRQREPGDCTVGEIHGAK